MIIQLLPKNKITEFCIYDAKYIYPKDINMTVSEYNKWVLNEIHNFSKHELYKTYVFDRVLYWKLENCHNVVIKRDKKWFKKNYPKFKNV